RLRLLEDVLELSRTEILVRHHDDAPDGPDREARRGRVRPPFQEDHDAVAVLRTVANQRCRERCRPGAKFMIPDHLALVAYRDVAPGSLRCAPERPGRIEISGLARIGRSHPPSGASSEEIVDGAPDPHPHDRAR